MVQERLKFTENSELEKQKLVLYELSKTISKWVKFNQFRFFYMVNRD